MLRPVDEISDERTRRALRRITEDEEDDVDSKLKAAWTMLGRRRRRRRRRRRWRRWRRPCRGAGALLFRKQWKGALFQALSGGQ